MLLTIELYSRRHFLKKILLYETFGHTRLKRMMSDLLIHIKTIKSVGINTRIGCASIQVTSFPDE